MTEREKELESRGPTDLNMAELGELYTLQIKSAGQEIAVRDRHLALLTRNVEDARAQAARKHEETVAYGALAHSALVPQAASRSLQCTQPASFALFG